MCHEQCAQGCSGNWQLCTPPANYAMTGVHKSTPAMGYCAHQPDVLWAVRTRVLRELAVVHTASQSCYEQCAQGCSGNWQLCTLPANYAMTGVHKSTPAMGYCAHQPDLLWAVCTRVLRESAAVHTTSQLCNDWCAQIYTSNGLLCTPARCAMSSVHKGAQGIAVVHTTSQLCNDWCAQI